MEILDIPVDLIDGSDRLRPVDPDYAALIGASMAQHGQRAPIEVMPTGVDGKFKLISGAHRLEGARRNGLVCIAAIVREVSDQYALLLEIDENLTRHDLNELDRSVFLLRRKDLYDAMYPETKQGAARWKGHNDKFVVLMKSFAEDTAEKLGCSKRSIERAVARVGKTGIFSDVQAMIGTSWIARRGSYLDKIAKLEVAEQRAVVRHLLTQSGGEKTLMTVADAIRQVRQVPDVRVDVADRDFKRLVKVWKGADITAREKFHRHIAAEARAQAAAVSASMGEAA